MQRYTFNLSAKWANDTGIDAVTVLAENIEGAVDALSKFADTETIVFHVVSVTTDIDVSTEARKALGGGQ